MWPESARDANYVGTDPDLPYMDHFLIGAADVINDSEVQAFVRAGLFRSFTARKVSLAFAKPEESSIALVDSHNERI